MKKIKLISDNLTDENNKKYIAITTKKDIEKTCKKLFNWRTPTKKYRSIYDRYQSQGSLNYDKVIKYIAERS